MTMKTTVFNVEGMSCGHCEKAVKNGVGELGGVSSVQVSLGEKTVTVAYDDDAVTAESIADAIEDLGYDVVK